MVSLISCPADLVKSRLQTQYHAKGFSGQYQGSLDCVQKALAEGGAKGLCESDADAKKGMYKGWTAQVAREIPGYSVYFVTYEVLKGAMRRGKCVVGLILSDSSSVGLDFAQKLLAGGMSGLAFWVDGGSVADTARLSLSRSIRSSQGFRLSQIDPQCIEVGPFLR